MSSETTHYLVMKIHRSRKAYKSVIKTEMFALLDLIACGVHDSYIFWCEHTNRTRQTNDEHTATARQKTKVGILQVNGRQVDSFWTAVVEGHFYLLVMLLI